MTKRTTYQRVGDCLEQYPTTRNSDKLLALEIWRQEGLELTPEQEQKFMMATSAETIRRNRQKWQEAGYFQATSRVKKNRKELEHQHKSQAVTDSHTPKAISWAYDD